MRPEEFDDLLRTKPFAPLRVRLKDGKTYDVIYPNLTMTTRPWLVIAFPDPESDGRWGDGYVTVQWDEIAGVERLQAQETRA